MIRQSILAALVVSLAAGCAAPARMHTPQQWQENTSRRFPGKSVEEVLQAGEEVLRLADGKDIQFVRQDARLLASRRWGKNLVVAAGFGVWNFDLAAVPDGGGCVATLKIVGTSESVAEMAAGTPSAPPAGEAGSEAAAAAPAVGGFGWPFAPAYDLFWRRMEAVLYGSAWFSCQWYMENPSLPNYSSLTVDPLCFKASDQAPAGAVASRAELDYWKKKGETEALAGGRVPQ